MEWVVLAVASSLVAGSLTLVMRGRRAEGRRVRAAWERLREDPRSQPHPKGLEVRREHVALLVHRLVRNRRVGGRSRDWVGVRATFALGAGPRFGRTTAPVDAELGVLLAEQHPDSSLDSDGQTISLEWEGRGRSYPQLTAAVDIVSGLAQHGVDRFVALADLDGARLREGRGPWDERVLPRIELTRRGTEIVLDPLPDREEGRVEVAMHTAARATEPARELTLAPGGAVPEELHAVAPPSALESLAPCRLRLDEQGATLLWPGVPSVEAASAGAELLTTLATATGAYR